MTPFSFPKRFFTACISWQAVAGAQWMPVTSCFTAEIVPEEAETVRWIYSLFLSGKTTAA